MQNEPIYRYARTGFTFEVYANRIEIVDKSGFGAVFSGGKRDAILLRNVTAVDVQGLTRKLHVTLSDGKTREFNLGAKADEARNAIIQLL